MELGLTVAAARVPTHDTIAARLQAKRELRDLALSAWQQAEREYAAVFAEQVKAKQAEETRRRSK